jgi:protein-tyrosine-phosphatase
VPTEPAQPLRVLFVCVENSCRSQMAEAFARKLGGERVDAHSAGSRASGVVNAKAIASMAQVGCDLAAQRSKSLAEVPQIEWDLAVTMGCGDACPSVRAKRRVDWQIPDPKHMPPREFAAVRDEIERRVRDLLTSTEPGSNR